MMRHTTPGVGENTPGHGGRPAVCASEPTHVSVAPWALRRRTKPGPLVLFDIDGTLVRRAGPHHRQALIEAVRRVTGLETTTDGIPLHGMLDPDILAQMMRNHGVPKAEIRRVSPVVFRLAEYYYVRNCPNLEEKTCPGVPRVLEKLEANGVVLGLVTGNLTRIGWKKLERAGLKQFFRFGAFGEMAGDRGLLAGLAIRQARALGWIERGARVSLVGDAGADVLAARRNGIQSIAVLTGIAPREELEALRPDVTLRDLRSLKLATVL